MKTVQAMLAAFLTTLLLIGMALPALAAQQGPVSEENVLVTCYHSAEFRSGASTTLQRKVQNEAGHAWTSVQVRIDPEETSYLSPQGTNIVDFQSLTVGESRTEDKAVSVSDTAPAGEYHFNIYVRLDGGEWAFLMRVIMHNTGPGVDFAMLGLGIAAVLGAVVIVLASGRARSRSRRPAGTTVPPAKKKFHLGHRPKVVSVRPRGDGVSTPVSQSPAPEVIATEEEIL